MRFYILLSHASWFPVIHSLLITIPVSLSPIFADSCTRRIDNRQKRVLFRIYPDGKSTRTFHLPKSDGIEYYDCTVSFDEQQQRFTLVADRAIDAIVTIGDKSIRAKGKKIDTVIK